LGNQYKYIFAKEAEEMIRLLLTVCVLFLTSGCASSLHEFHNRAVVEDNISDAVGTLSLNAQRRTVIVGLHGINRGKFCAEPPPDVAESVTTELDAKLKAEIAKIETNIEGGINDKLITQITVLAERTAILDIFRTGTYALCQYHLNGAIKDNEMKHIFEELTQNVLAKFETQP
jgi:hypothetical protein